MRRCESLRYKAQELIYWHREQVSPTERPPPARRVSFQSGFCKDQGVPSFRTTKQSTRCRPWSGREGNCLGERRKQNLGWAREREYLLQLGGEGSGDVVHELLSGTVVSTLEAIVGKKKSIKIATSKLLKQNQTNRILGSVSLSFARLGQKTRIKIDLR